MVVEATSLGRLPNHQPRPPQLLAFACHQIISLFVRVRAFRDPHRLLRNILPCLSAASIAIP